MRRNCQDVEDLSLPNPLPPCRDRSSPNFTDPALKDVRARFAPIFHGEAVLKLKAVRGYGEPRVFRWWDRDLSRLIAARRKTHRRHR